MSESLTVSIESGGNKKECSKCGKSFRKSSQLKRHLTVHLNIKPFICTDCDRCFKRLAALKFIHKDHKDEQLFFCSICNKTYHTAYKLKEHIIIHTKTEHKRTLVSCERTQCYYIKNCII